MPVEALRHLSVFSPTEFGNTRIDVIGAGATGSAITLELAKLGVTNLHSWDFDTVEDHNLANQCFGTHDVGALKVEALQRRVKADADVDLIIHPEAVEATTKVRGKVVFLLTDSMASRREIAEKCLHRNLNTQLCIETRMGTEMGMIYAFNPNNPAQFKAWQDTLYTDAEAVTSACGTSVTVGATAKLITGMAVWQFLLFNRGQEVTNETTICMNPMLMNTRQFPSV